MYVTKDVIQTSWQAVPGNYKGVCIEASNVAKTCQSASHLKSKYGNAGSSR
ncbi:MAG: hypothetical protein ABIN55_00010 [Aeromicrobium sp.]